MFPLHLLCRTEKDHGKANYTETNHAKNDLAYHAKANDKTHPGCSRFMQMMWFLNLRILVSPAVL